MCVGSYLPFYVLSFHVAHGTGARWDGGREPGRSLVLSSAVSEFPAARSPLWPHSPPLPTPDFPCPSGTGFSSLALWEFLLELLKMPLGSYPDLM